MKILFLELNEFNEDLLKQASETFQLKNIQKMVSFYRTETLTDDTYDSDFLEPWVQWVSVHTGTPSSIHGIKHLGDVPELKTPQAWEALSDQGVTSGIWGAMNASRRAAKNCLFFLPDPWTGSEKAYPLSLNRLLDPVRYTSKNYLNRSLLEILQKLKGFLSLFIENNLGFSILKGIPRLVYNLIKFKGSHFVFIAFAEKLSALLFLKYRATFNPDFSLLFINTLAHLQHHYWKDSDYKTNERLHHGLIAINEILGSLFASLKEGDLFLVANALSQKNTSEEKPWILYRQIDQKTFLEAIGISNCRIEAYMTHDAHLFFNQEEECQKAKEKLVSAEMCGQNVFLVESYPENPKKLFYRLAFTDEVPKETHLNIQGNSFPFFDLFKPIVKRTGKHIQIGTLYSNQDLFPKTIKNHEIFKSIISIYEKRTS
jgi:hypothetical protein